jgi:hypothetical protein
MSQAEMTETKKRGEDHPDVTREELYALVWSEPILKVATKFGVSSSYRGEFVR